MKDSSVSSIEKYIAGQRVIGSMRRLDDLGDLINHNKIKTIFVLNCNIFELKQIVVLAQQQGKNVFVHIDLVEGLGKDGVGVRFLARTIGVQGIITTKSGLIKAAKGEGLVTIQRFFMVDSEAVKTGIKLAKAAKPDALEILPAFLPQYYLDILHRELRLPVLAGGLIRDSEDAAMLLERGFRAITTSRRTLWDI